MCEKLQREDGSGKSGSPKTNCEIHVSINIHLTRNLERVRMIFLKYASGDLSGLNTVTNS